MHQRSIIFSLLALFRDHTRPVAVLRPLAFLGFAMRTARPSPGVASREGALLGHASSSPRLTAPLRAPLARARVSSVSGGAATSADLWSEHPASLLGVQRGAPHADAKAAFRALCKRLHPDVSDHPQAGLRFEALTRAYDAYLSGRPSFSNPLREAALAAATAGSTASASWPPPQGGAARDAARHQRPRAKAQAAAAAAAAAAEAECAERVAAEAREAALKEAADAAQAEAVRLARAAAAARAAEARAAASAARGAGSRAATRRREVRVTGVKRAAPTPAVFCWEPVVSHKYLVNAGRRRRIRVPTGGVRVAGGGEGGGGVARVVGARPPRPARPPLPRQDVPRRRPARGRPRAVARRVARRRRAAAGGGGAGVVSFGGSVAPTSIPFLL